MISIIIPTLNEGRTIGDLLQSLERQSWNNFEVIIVDGGSKDSTIKIAREYGVKVIVEPKCPEFKSREIGVGRAKGSILLFTCADIIFPEHLMRNVSKYFTNCPKLIALSGPGIPIDAPILGYIEYGFYNFARYLLNKLPGKLKRFSTSTNLLAVRKLSFNKTNGFLNDDVNADGVMGRQLAEMGQVGFHLDTFVYISARRMRNMGFIKFNQHYLYVLENFLPFLSETAFIGKMKHRSGAVHGEMHKQGSENITNS